MISVPLRTRRYQRAQLAQKVQHAVPSIVLLGDGLTRVTGGGEHGQSFLLGALEIIAAGLVIITVVRGFIKFRAGQGKPEGSPSPIHQTHGVDWIDICIGAMLVVETYMHYHETGRIKGPTVLLAAVMFGFGFFHGRITAFAHRRRSMHVSADGISIPGRLPFMRVTLPWADVASVEIDGDTARIVANNGRVRVIDCTDAIDSNAVRQALLAAKTHHEAFAAARSAEGVTPA
jgi:hypothetical protein